MNPTPSHGELDAEFLDARLSEGSIERLRKEIISRVSPDEIRAAYISTGPTPASPDTVLDVFLLTDTFIYNYEITKAFNDQWFTLPLTSVSYIVENRSPQDDRFWSMLIVIRADAGQPGLALQDTTANRDKISKFADACRDKLSAVIDVQGRIQEQVRERIGVN